MKCAECKYMRKINNRFVCTIDYEPLPIFKKCDRTEKEADEEFKLHNF